MNYKTAFDNIMKAPRGVQNVKEARATIQAMRTLSGAIAIEKARVRNAGGDISPIQADHEKLNVAHLEICNNNPKAKAL